MQRLYWKFFLSFWAALVLFAGASILVTSHYLDQLREQQESTTPREYFMRHIAEAQAAADRDGLDGLRAWARRIDRTEAVPLLVLDAQGNDLLGRDVPTAVRERFLRHRDVRERPPGSRHPFERTALALPDGSRYWLMPDFQSVTLGRILGRPRVFAVPVTVAALVSGLVCFLLARYLTAPIERLRRATESYARGDLTHRVAPTLGRRRDEIVDLAVAFDHMAAQLNVLMHSHKQLLRDVSHELRSPLARLQAALGLARQRSGDAAQPELDRIEREAERLNELIGQLLSLARLESATQQTPMEALDLSEILDTVVADARLEAHTRPCEVQLETSAPVTVRGNAQLLHSALENVLRNAVHYTAAATTVLVRVERAPRQRDIVRIEISDHGPGVPEELLTRLFEPFMRVGEARERGGGGYGLGLAIADRAVRLHGGDIFAANVPDGGLRVTIELPVNAPAVA